MASLAMGDRPGRPLTLPRLCVGTCVLGCGTAPASKAMAALPARCQACGHTHSKGSRTWALSCACCPQRGGQAPPPCQPQHGPRCAHAANRRAHGGCASTHTHTRTHAHKTPHNHAHTRTQQHSTTNMQSAQAEGEGVHGGTEPHMCAHTPAAHTPAAHTHAYIRAHARFCIAMPAFRWRSAWRWC